MRSPIHRFFLVVEGLQDGYPNYRSAKVHFSTTDPCNLEYKNLFICSPLFSLSDTGVDAVPELTDDTRIVFIMVPNVFPTFDDILSKFNVRNNLWFSLGLANLVIIETNAESVSDKIIKYLEDTNNITAYEKWKIAKGSIDDSVTRHIKHESETIKHFDIKLSEKLPLYLSFSVSEFIISIDKFLTASKKFTPHYYSAHCKTVKASLRLANDLAFLYQDYTIDPSKSLLGSLNAQNKIEAEKIVQNPDFQQKVEEIVNDRHGRLIQFNSAMSYVYSQAYSGTFPIFDHIGIVRRHSLLGLGSAISALFELLSQIEEALNFLPFEDFKKTTYNNTNIPSEYLNVLREPSTYSSNIWENDAVAMTIVNSNIPKLEDRKGSSEGFFNRLAFYSGRLGFREYDFSATAAIQVLVESNSLQWNIINYTHEIIHNHVRIILTRNLLNIPQSIRKSSYPNELQDRLEYLKSVLENKHSPTTYKDYFISLLINYCINAKYYGSISKESDYEMIEEKRTASYLLPTPSQLKELINYIFKDINEIFVHVIDFSYIYKRNTNYYVLSIWASWSTVTSVTNDLKQYIVRTLNIIALSIKGTSYNRFQESKKIFLSLIPELSKRNNNAYIFTDIQNILNTTSESDDILYRFYNCIILSDLVYNFLVGKLEVFLDNNDENVIDIEIGPDDTSLYNIETGIFKSITIKSKVRFLLDQLIKEINTKAHDIPTQQRERISSWLLLSLSSYNND